jgi:hypothetical protein
LACGQQGTNRFRCCVVLVWKTSNHEEIDKECIRKTEKRTKAENKRKSGEKK